MDERIIPGKANYSLGKGFDNDFKVIERRDEKLVSDRKSGLTWQQSGSKGMTYADAEKYVSDLRSKKIAGYDDWRLPTLEEAMSLMEREKNSDGLYIKPLFDKTQRCIWTTDQASDKIAWVVFFELGNCTHYYVDVFPFVRAVR